MSERKTIPFCCHYHHDGGTWAVIIHAYDWDDAHARAKKLCLSLDGEYVGSVPGAMGFMAKAFCWAKNTFRQHSEGR